MQKMLSVVSVVFITLFIISSANAQENKGDAYYDFGVFAYEDQDYQAAEQNFLNALKFDPKNPFYSHFLGKVYLKMGKYGQASIYLTKAYQLKPDIVGLKYDIAFLNYKTGKYLKASNLFTEIIREDPENVLAYYYGGISQYKVEKYGKALNNFMIAAEKNPSVKASSFYYAGICFFKMSRLNEAKDRFEYVASHGDEALKKNVSTWLKAVEIRKKSFQPYSLYVTLGHQYDDNVRLEPLDREDLYSDEDDYVTFAYFSGKYNFINRNDYKLGAGYNHYQTWHSSLKEYDLIGSTFRIYGKYNINSFTIGLTYLPSYYWVDNNSYLMRHQIKPEVFWKVTDNLTARVVYNYYHNKYFENDGRNGHTHGGWLDFYYFIPSHKILLSVSGGYENNYAAHNDYDYNQWKSKLGVTFNLPWKLSINVSGKYYYKDYDNIDSKALIKREDDKYYAAISIEREIFWSWLKIACEYNYTRNDSNINDYNYKRNVIGLSLSARY